MWGAHEISVNPVLYLCTIQSFVPETKFEAYGWLARQPDARNGEEVPGVPDGAVPPFAFLSPPSLQVAIGMPSEASSHTINSNPLVPFALLSSDGRPMRGNRELQEGGRQGRRGAGSLVPISHPTGD
eukprot:7695648-Pyramimonas_sp.AAC.1